MVSCLWSFLAIICGICFQGAFRRHHCSLLMQLKCFFVLELSALSLQGRARIRHIGRNPPRLNSARFCDTAVGYSETEIVEIWLDSGPGVATRPPDFY